MKKFLLTAVILSVLFMSGCGEDKNQNGLPDSDTIIPDNETIMPDDGTMTPDTGMGTNTNPNSAITGDVK